MSTEVSTTRGIMPRRQGLGPRIFALLDKLLAGDFEGPEQVLSMGERVRSWAVPPLRIYDQRQPDALWVIRIYHQALPPIVR
jgi:hypothetical protein